LTVAALEVWNRNQGSQFTSPQYTDLLKAVGVRISMDGKGRALDNVFIKRLWRTVEYEEIYLREYTSRQEARRSLSTWWTFYNQQRLHRVLGYCPVAAVYNKAGGKCG
jgi:putative transposase